jgi:hypothetical protein
MLSSVRPLQSLSFPSHVSVWGNTVCVQVAAVDEHCNVPVAQGPFCPGTVHGAFGVHGTLHTPFLHAVPVTQSASTVQVAPGALGPKQVPD